MFRNGGQRTRLTFQETFSSNIAENLKCRFSASFLCIFPSVFMPFSLSRLSSFTPFFILSLFCFLVCFFLLYAFFWVIPRRLKFIWRRFETLCSIFMPMPMKMEQTECSETLAYKIQTPENYPEGSIKHSEHGESLKSRMFLPLLLCPMCLADLSFLLREENRICQRNMYVSHSCSVVLTYATRSSGCGAQGSFQQRRERLARATTRRPLDTTSFVHTPGIPILNKTVGLSTVAAATCLKPPSQPNVLRRVPKD